VQKLDESIEARLREQERERMTEARGPKPPAGSPILWRLAAFCIVLVILAVVLCVLWTRAV